MGLGTFFAKLSAKLAARSSARAATKAAAKTAQRAGVKVAGRFGVRTGIVVGAGGLLAMSNMFQGDGLLGWIGDALGLDGVAGTVLTIGIVAAGLFGAYVVLSRMMRRRR